MVMAKKFNAYLQHIDPGFWQELCVGNGKLRSYVIGEEFASVGYVARNIGFVKSGAFKYVAFADDGTEHVVGLVFPGEFVADFPFCFYDHSSSVSIVATRPSEIYELSTAELKHRINDDDVLRDKVLKDTDALFYMVYNRYISLYTKSASHRYEELLTNHTELFETFSLKDIASFLNITPTHLSRLRKS